MTMREELEKRVLRPICIHVGDPPHQVGLLCELCKVEEKVRYDNGVVIEPEKFRHLRECALAEDHILTPEEARIALEGFVISKVSVNRPTHDLICQKLQAMMEK